MPFSEVYNHAEKLRVAHTIGALRRMRHAADVALLRDENVQGVLNDAELLTKASAPYLVNLLNQSQKPEMLDQWEETLSDMELKYQRFAMIRRSPFSSSAEDIELHLRMLEFGKSDLITKYYIGSNAVELKLEDLFTDRMGILSPLSTDAFTASLLPEYIKLHHAESAPEVKPVYVSTDVKQVFLPHDEFGNPALLIMERIMTFVDLNAGGGTRRALVKAAELDYPGKVVKTGRY